MTEALISGLLQVFSWPAIGYLGFGIILGIWLGALPGVGGVTGLILLLPFTYALDPVSAFALMLGMFAVTTTSDTIASVMLGIPGTVASQATVLDGYPLAQKGQAQRALGAAYTCSAIGGVIGAVILTLSIPLVHPILSSFSTPEYFMLALLGICMVGSLSSANIAKGLVVAALGMMMGTIGDGTFNGVPRYWFGVEYMLQVPPLVSVVLGLFAVSELLDLATRTTSISRVSQSDAQDGKMLRGITDVFKNWWLVLKSSALGTYIGMLPGLGASIVDWAAYGMAVQTTKGPNTFGRGDIRGVIAPESANNAQRGGALIPTLTFGIPGDFAMSILLGAMLIQGIRPGLDMLTVNLDLTYAMIWTLIIANIVSALLLMVIGKQVARAIFVDGHYLVPIVMLFVFMGSWLGSKVMGDLILMLLMGFVGLIMKRSGWPRPPLVIALVLGPNMENAFTISNRIYGSFGWLERTPSQIILALIVLTIGGTVLAQRRRRGKVAMAPAADEMPNLNAKLSIEGGERNPMISLPFAAVLIVLFATAAIIAIDFHHAVRLYPMMISITAVLLLLTIVRSDYLDAARERQSVGSWRVTWSDALEKSDFVRGLYFCSWVAGAIFLIWLFGNTAGVAMFMGAYVIVWGKKAWWVGLVYASGGYLFITAFYHELMHIPLQRPAIFGILGGS
ncbi:MAG: tripartite tricarboxylate transporter permease [Pseudomonadota bacterium]